MTPPDQNPTPDRHDDPTAERRKHDHIALAFQSRVAAGAFDDRFYYEPMLAAHPDTLALPPFPFLGKTLHAPMWVSSMTGGTALAGAINRNLARACAEFGIGMGLGSCRQLLFSDEFLPDFDVRDTIGADGLLFANLGTAQIEQLIEQGEVGRIHELVRRLRADGLIIHVNPLQEAMQPEGDQFRRPPLEVIQEVLGSVDFPIIVKEVGQGFGPASLRALMQLPLGAIEFAAGGGTNFALLELLRSDEKQMEAFGSLARVGHTATDMLNWANEMQTAMGAACQTKHLIISGGVGDFLDGYYLIRKATLPAVYGQASAFLQHAREDYDTLRQFVARQIQGLALANAFLHIRS